MYANIQGKKIGEHYPALLRRSRKLSDILGIFIVLADKAGWSHSEILEAVADALSDGKPDTLKQYCL